MESQIKPDVLQNLREAHKKADLIPQKKTCIVEAKELKPLKPKKAKKLTLTRVAAEKGIVLRCSEDEEEAINVNRKLGMANKDVIPKPLELIQEDEEAKRPSIRKRKLNKEDLELLEKEDAAHAPIRFVLPDDPAYMNWTVVPVFEKNKAPPTLKEKQRGQGQGRGQADQNKVNPLNAPSSFKIRFRIKDWSWMMLPIIPSVAFLLLSYSFNRRH